MKYSKEIGSRLGKLLGKKSEVARDDWRAGDQKVFYSGFCKAQCELGWESSCCSMGV
jgi:hypothetical protein